MDLKGQQPCPVQSYTPAKVSFEEVVQALADSLSENFGSVDVAVEDCPDLSASPYFLAAKGLCGNPSLVDVGGKRFFEPLPQLDRRYDFQAIKSLAQYPEDCFMLGCSAGPFHETGCNCELMVDLYLSSTAGESKNVSQIARVTKDGHKLMPATSTNFAILGNLFLSEGKPGKVIQVKAKRRTGATNFVTCMREGLQKKFPGQAVALGGIFLIKTGDVSMCIMPDFSETPLNSQADVDTWIKRFTFPSPMIFQTVFVSEDPGRDLRLEHTHGHGLLNAEGIVENGCGGHFTTDATPDEVEYIGFFNVAETLHRIDRPAAN